MLVLLLVRHTGTHPHPHPPLLPLPPCMQVLLPVFDTEQEPSPSALLESREVVTINMFDEVVRERTTQPYVPRINE